MSLLAKSTGEELEPHTDYTVEIIDLICERYNIDNGIVSPAGKLHDIGKIDRKNQKMLNNEKVKLKHNHHIYSWAFIKEWIKHPYVKEIANLVLWHHPNLNDCSKLNSTDILNDLAPQDLLLMKEFAVKQGFSIKSDDEVFYMDNFTNKFSDNDNFLRSILIFADSCSSSNMSKEDAIKLFDKEIVSYSNIDITPRTQYQIDIVDKIIEKNTTLVKAPAGFGKTIVGILWGLSRNRKLLWVCPTNSTAESVFSNILSDLKTIGCKKDVSVELYLGGNKISSTHNLEDFTSDIVVTNIDNFIKPTVENSFSKRSMAIYLSDIIFDEYHMLETMQCALHKSYNNIMNYRHNILNSTTLLLSATPSVFGFTNLEGKQIIQLPNEREHYPAAHDKEIKIEILEKDHNINLDNYVYFSNTIPNAQKNYLKNRENNLISHAGFELDDKISKKNKVLDIFGKNSTRKNENILVFTTSFLMTACDYSVRNLIAKCPTLASFIQAIGRMNRMGEYANSIVYIINDLDASNKCFLGLELKLYETFISEFKAFLAIKNVLTLNELYIFYNSFVAKHKRMYMSVLSTNLELSAERLSKIYPKKRKSYPKSDNIVAGSNKLRCVGHNEIYISIMRTDESGKSGRAVLPHTLRQSAYKEFGEDSKTLKKQLKIIKELGMYDKHAISSLTSEKLLENAIYYDTPYIVENIKYCSDIGRYEI